MKLLNFLFIIFLFSTSVFSQVSRIILDEQFDDWQPSDLYHTDGQNDAGSSGINFHQLWISHDDNYLFLRFNIGKEIQFQENNAIRIFIDTDNNATTGSPTKGIGVDLAFFPGEREGVLTFNNMQYFISHAQIGWISSPTVSGEEFEIAIRRDASFAGNPIFTSNEIKIAIIDNSLLGDQLPDDDGGISYTFTGSPTEMLPSYSIQKRASHHTRFLSLNVQVNGLFSPSQIPAFTRVIQAIEPDIIGFQEIYDYSSTETAALVEAMLPSGSGKNWYHAKGGPDNIVVSRYPVLSVHKIPGFIPDQGNGAFLLDVGGGNELLFIVAHLPCCENEDERQNEIDRILEFIRNAKAGIGTLTVSPNTPIVIVGDMNMVGERSQQVSLITGDIYDESSYGPDFFPDWDDMAFGDATPLATHTPHGATWVNPFSSFSPGRLDYILYTESVMTLKNSYVLNTQALPSDSLSMYGLNSLDDTASDHLPVVSDFEIDFSTNITDLPNNENGFILAQNQPNPFHEKTGIRYVIPKNGFLHLAIYDGTGKRIKTLVETQQTVGEHNVIFNRSDLPDGIYFCKGIFEEQVIIQKMIHFGK